MKSSHRGFTLIELSTVVAIILLVLGMTVPAVKNFSRSTSLQTAGAKVSGLISAARQNSMARNALSAVVVLTDASLAERNRAMAIYELPQKADGSSPSSTDWRQISAWEVLPEGILLDQSTFETDPNAVLPALPQPSFRGSSVPAFQYVVFLPDGTIYDPEANSIRVVEGVWPKGAASPVYTHSSGGGAPADLFNISIISASGRLKIDQL